MYRKALFLTSVRALLCFISCFSNTRQLHLHKRWIPFKCSIAHLMSSSSPQCSLPRGKCCAVEEHISFFFFLMFAAFLLCWIPHSLCTRSSWSYSAWPLFSLRLVSDVGLQQWLFLRSVQAWLFFQNKSVCCLSSRSDSYSSPMSAALTSGKSRICIWMQPVVTATGEVNVLSSSQPHSWQPGSRSLF